MNPAAITPQSHPDRDYPGETRRRPQATTRTSDPCTSAHPRQHRENANAGARNVTGNPNRNRAAAAALPAAKATNRPAARIVGSNPASCSEDRGIAA